MIIYLQHRDGLVLGYSELKQSDYDIEYDVDASELVNIGFYRVENGRAFYDDKIEQDTKNRTFKFEKIAELKQNLNNTDYKIVKCYEATMLGEPLPYDLAAIVAERRAWREELQALGA